MNVLEAGNGRPILFIHGWPRSARVWKYQLDGLSGEHHVLAVDLPGFGASPPLERPTIAAFAAAVRDFIDERELSDVFLIGWSMGAEVVMSYCEQFGSHRLRAIGIVDDCPKLLPGRAGNSASIPRSNPASSRIGASAGSRTGARSCSS